ncbi:unnamed protein product [Lupinus luteus]|uniref:Transmembrane protein n=1 Tax=Lupinus luteus TaxID=3873 RepID=A0AAV1VW39_LUPLU
MAKLGVSEDLLWSKYIFFTFPLQTNAAHTLITNLSILMGNLNQPFTKFLCITLLFHFLVSYTTSSSSSNKQIQPQYPSSTTLSHYHTVFYLKNDDPKFFTKQETIKKRKRSSKKHRKKMSKNNGGTVEASRSGEILVGTEVPDNEREACEFALLGNAKKNKRD